MGKQGKQNFVTGALILALGTIVVKLVGAVFKIPLTGMITPEGLGYYNTAYDIYLPIYSLTIAGFPVAVARMVAESAAKGNFREVRKIYAASKLVFFVAGLLGTLLLFVGSFAFTRFIDNPEAVYAMRVLAPTLFFSCFVSAQRGYYTGLRNMYPTAVSQIIEALAKLIIGLSLAYLTVQYGMSQYESTGMVFGKLADSAELARRYTYPYAAAAAISGVTVGSILALIYMVLLKKIQGDSITKEDLRASPPSRSGRELCRDLIKISVPVCLGALVTNVSSLIDVTLMQRRITALVEVSEAQLRQLYEGLLPATIESGKIANYLYGCYGYAFILFSIVPAITQSFGVSALPNVTAAWTTGNRKKLRLSIESALRVTGLVTIPAGIGLCVLSGPILNLLYSSSPQGVAIATPLLSILGIAVIFMSFCSPLNSILQAIGRQDIPVKLLLCGAGIKIVLNHFLIGNININIKGAPIGTLSCYVFVMVASLVFVCKLTRTYVNLLSVFIKPCIAGVFCGLSAYLANRLLCMAMPDKLAVIVSIIIGAIVYAIVLLTINGVTKEDVFMLPKGEKIYKTLAKHKLIG